MNFNAFGWEAEYSARLFEETMALVRDEVSRGTALVSLALAAIAAEVGDVDDLDRWADDGGRAP
jgi:hypothetical protein